MLTPPVPEQRAIAHILGTLDDKIELNRRMNETLEEMARALFQSWFVDFDPVRAKMEGSDTGLPPDLAALFPDRLVDSELGLIPEGWEVRSLGEVVRERGLQWDSRPFQATTYWTSKGEGLPLTSRAARTLAFVTRGTWKFTSTTWSPRLGTRWPQRLSCRSATSTWRGRRSALGAALQPMRHQSG